MADQGEKREKKRGRKKKKEKKKRMGLWPLVHAFVKAIEPFVCISPHSFSEKPPPRGCRHCWPNHVKYCVHCCVFSPPSLCLVGLSHRIGPLSCRSSPLRGFVRNPNFFCHYIYHSPYQREMVSGTLVSTTITLIKF